MRAFGALRPFRFSWTDRHTERARTLLARRKQRLARIRAVEPLEDRRLLAANPQGWDNLGAELGALVGQIQQASPEPIAVEQLLATKSDHWYVDGDRVYVEVRGRGEYEPFLTAVRDAGLDVRASWPQPLLAEGFVSLTAIPALATLTETISVLPVYRIAATDSQGAVSNVAEDILQAELIRNLFGINGSGVTVGVISDSANQVPRGLRGSIDSGDLPELNVGTFLDIDGPPDSLDEGRAMTELIHDIAPGSVLRFASGIGGEAQFATAVNTLVRNGANIIVDDLNGLQIEPYFYDGVAAQAVADAVSSGVHYFSSAGNRGAGGYETPYRFFETAVADIPGEWHDFGGGPNALQRVDLPAGRTTFVFQFDDFWGSVDTDLDFYILDGSGSVVATGTDDNTSTQVAREIVTVDLESAGSVNIAVLNNTPTARPTRWKYIAINNDAAATQIVGGVGPDAPEGAFLTAHNPGHNAVAGAMSVAAANAATPSTPAPYSSVGPVTRVFDSTGNRLSTPEVRNKPDVTSIDGVNTTVPRFQTFFGTSAAAANAAAVAALLLELQPGLTTTQLKTALQNGARDLAPPAEGYDFTTGFGLIDAFASAMEITEGTLHIAGDRDSANPDDQFLLRQTLSGLEIVLNGDTLGSVSFDLVQEIVLDGLGGDDLLTLDFSGGNPFPNFGIQFNGGSNTVTGDRIELVNGSVTRVVHQFDSPDSGIIRVESGGSSGDLRYTG